MRKRTILGAVTLFAALGLFIAAAVLWPQVSNLRKTLETELAATPTPSPDTRSVMAVTLNPNLTPTPTPMLLRQGSRGSEVREAQERLIRLGYLQGEADGGFGAATREAVLRFQEQNGLKADGLIGDETWDLLFSESAPAALPTPSPTPADSLLKKGSKGEAVKELQSRLAELGYLEDEPDGTYGVDTETAVTRFQRQAGLSADGAAGEQTRAALFAENAPTAAPVVAFDPEAMPVLVNRTHPVTEADAPSDLVKASKILPSSLCKVKGSDIQGDRTALGALKTMLEAAAAEGVKNWQLNAGYRSIAYQQKLFNNSVQEYMDKGFSRSKAQSATRQTVADPGTSEHHTGLAFDVSVPGASQFLGTDQEIWLRNNCWDYGFIIRYTKEKESITGYIAECWHIRYVGLPHSQTMHEMNECLEEYLNMTD